jgi:hypothetical protein
MGIVSGNKKPQERPTSIYQEVFLLIETREVVETESIVIGTDIVMGVFSSREKANKAKKKLEKIGRDCRVSRFLVDEE